MKPRFVGQPWFRKLPDSRSWVVRDAFEFHGRIVVQVPAGFVSDGASVPRLFWIIYPPAGRYMSAAVVHDACYRLHPVPVSRRDADGIMVEAMEACGCSLLTRWVFWLALRAFGWIAWKKGKA